MWLIFSLYFYIILSISSLYQDSSCPIIHILFGSHNSSEVKCFGLFSTSIILYFFFSFICQHMSIIDEKMSEFFTSSFYQLQDLGIEIWISLANRQSCNLREWRTMFSYYPWKSSFGDSEIDSSNFKEESEDRMNPVLKCFLKEHLTGWCSSARFIMKWNDIIYGAAGISYKGRVC